MPDDWPGHYFANWWRSPFEEFNKELQRIERMMFTPYWRHVPFNRDFCFGEGSGQVVNDDERFSVALDVAHFRPDELQVNVNGRELIIEGKHDERVDEHGSIQRMFIRKFNLPNDANLDAVRSSLTEQGVLQIEAPKQGALPGTSRAIPIEPASKITN